MPSVFLDTNVLVYTQVASEPLKCERSRDWLKTATRSRSATISVQVLNELYWTLSRTYSRLFDVQTARLMTRQLAPIATAPLDLGVHAAAHEVQERTGYVWWDCLLIASAQAARCAIFLSEDLHHDRDLAGLRIVNPFLVEPGDVLDA